ncbi:MAG TPA: hypothetical protein VEL07_02850 [Planctomycetota bacterium]|nr:hypothetical protein [Planctomycetota bacterium]
MHAFAVVMLAAAGLAYCGAAALRWRALRAPGDTKRAHPWLVVAGLLLHSAGVALSLLDNAHQPFLFGAVAAWAAVACVVFLGRFLAVPSTWLLVLPIGGVALLVAGAGIAAPPAGGGDGGGGWITGLHLAFMAAHLAATLVAGAAGALWLVAVRQLKSATVGAFRLPNLPLLERLSERALVAATALLIGGLATGGAAMRLGGGFSLAHPTVILALATMAVLTVALGLRAVQRLSRRGIAGAAIICMVLGALSLVSLVPGRHG